MGNSSGFRRVTDSGGGVYEGELQVGMKHGKGRVTTKSYFFEGTWERDYPVEGIFYFPNGKKIHAKYKDRKIDKTETKMSVRIKQEDFKLDIPFLTAYLANPSKVPDEVPYYELNFIGSVTQGDTPIKGDLYIPGVFQFSGEWRDGLLNCRNILYDTREKTATEVHFIDGVEMPINKQK
jgi:hypothetical protein